MKNGQISRKPWNVALKNYFLASFQKGIRDVPLWVLFDEPLMAFATFFGAHCGPRRFEIMR